MFEYDISGTGRGEWEPAQARDGVAGFRARIPDSGLLDFRVRGEAGAVQNLIVDFSIRTAHAQPAFLSAPKEILDSVPDGQSAKFTMYFPRAGAHHEFEVRSNAATPRIVISDANGGGGFGYETLEESGKVGLYRFVVPAEDRYQISVNLADYTAGSFVLRPWQPARLQRR
ncbi:MAG TPA: hypothetical protein VK477_04005, partial [Acidobacteriota bacterium]|nr:hypothetical protein [Acidobacteriota bacterium]